MSTLPAVVNPAELQPPPVSSAAKDEIHFPESAFTGLGGEFVSIYSPRLESPPEFLFASWHAAFGTAISPYVRLNSALGLPQEPRIRPDTPRPLGKAA